MRGWRRSCATPAQLACDGRRLLCPRRRREIQAVTGGQPDAVAVADDGLQCWPSRSVGILLSRCRRQGEQLGAIVRACDQPGLHHVLRTGLYPRVRRRDQSRQPGSGGRGERTTERVSRRRDRGGGFCSPPLPALTPRPCPKLRRRRSHARTRCRSPAARRHRTMGTCRSPGNCSGSRRWAQRKYRCQGPRSASSRHRC
jgi:hypothetical protein